MKGRLKSALALFFLAICQCVFCQAQVRYGVSLENAERHLVQITLEVPQGSDARELQLPVWNALYQVRDFSQYMSQIHAEDASGRPLKIVPINKSRWRITGAANGARMRYEMFCDNPGPFGAEFNGHHAFFNLAEILLYTDDQRSDPVQIEFQNLPARWKIATPLQAVGDAFLADNYDRLVDSPVEIGDFRESDFDQDKGHYRVIVDAEPGDYDMEKIVGQLRKIVAAATNWINDRPFETYIFIYHFPRGPTGGGMEHAYSTAINMNADVLRRTPARFAGVTAHEFFHLWNVKRIRPQSLEPIDYTKENYTPALWFSEGVDSTASDYIQLRAGLLDERHFLDHLAQEITELQNRPAHLTQSVEESSLDAWLEKHPYYGLPERSISYYEKGELLGVLLDLAMRNASQDRASLRDLFRWLNEQYAKQTKFFADSEALQQAAETLSRADLRTFFLKYVSGTEEIPWDEFLAPVGLHLLKQEVAVAAPGFDAVQKFDQPPAVVRVQPGSEAERAGLKPDDVIVQINGKSVGRDFETQLAAHGPGVTLRLLVSRDGREQELKWRLGSRNQTTYQLQNVPNINAQQKARRAAWLFDRSEQIP